MKKILIFTVALILLAGAAVNAGAQDVKDILNKMIDAQGGRKALEAVADVTISGSLDLIQMGMSGNITLYQKYPDKIRIDMEVMGIMITEVYDGEKAWWTNPQSGGAVEELPDLMAENMKRQAFGARAVLDPEKYGISFAAKGKEKINDKEYLVLEQSFKDGYKTTIYVDPASYLIYKTRAKSLDATGSGAEVDTESVSEDYKNEGGLIMAHKISTFQNGAAAMTMAFVKISANSKLEDALFKISK
jgi:outer membrane lipoprotein-sorting protein